MLVTMELFRVPWARVSRALARMATDRPRLAATPGLRFWKLLGTGDGRTFDLRDADPRTWGVLAVWADAEAAARFASRSPVAAGWRRIAEEAWKAELRPLATRGRWSGVEPFEAGRGAGVQAHGEPGAERTGRPVAAITRARLRPGKMRTFWRAVPPVTADLGRQRGLRLSVGIGEAPLGLQGTFSVWSSLEELTTFAYRRSPHRAVVEATPREGWYAEELFARFTVERSRGTIFGRDPAVSGGAPAGDLGVT